MPGHNYLEYYLCSKCGDKPSKKKHPNLTRCIDSKGVGCKEKLRTRPKTSIRKRRSEYQSGGRY